ncbi:reticulon-like protein B22 isoform X2 [Brassica napus]|uniref:reticulon-like protein B22 isoform X2 n=1 Tax=Brassica napus TaxID=3708 RepID=UPI00207AC461|nr:reticulon-like protein B22 isoform X2 [Brassica napus]
MGEVGKAMGLLISGTLVYYHCSYRNATILSLFADVLIVLLCSLAILGLLFRQLNVSVPVDPLEWQISQDTASNIVARLANTVGAAEAVLRVAATGHDKRLFVKANARVMHFLLGRDLLILFVSPRTTYIRCNRCVCRTMHVLSLHSPLSELSTSWKLCTEARKRRGFRTRCTF